MTHQCPLALPLYLLLTHRSLDCPMQLRHRGNGVSRRNIRVFVCSSFWCSNIFGDGIWNMYNGALKWRNEIRFCPMNIRKICFNNLLWNSKLFALGSIHCHFLTLLHKKKEKKRKKRINCKNCARQLRR